jgi:CheY-like chemotaxis protein
MYKYKKVLIIDDLSIDRLIAERIIKGTSFSDSVQAFETARDALVYLHSIADEPSEYPDLILLDIAMPVMNGYDFLDEYIHLPQALRSHCKVVMLSSSISAADQERVASYSYVDGFLVKPFNKNMLTTLESL